MPGGLDVENAEQHLKSLPGNDIALLALTHPSEPPHEAIGKSYEYGSLIRVDYRAADEAHLLRHAGRRSEIFDPAQIHAYCGS